MKTYTLKELEDLRKEYVATLLSVPDSWYASEQEVTNDALVDFLGWLNAKEQTP